MDTIRGRVHSINFLAKEGSLQHAQWELDALNRVYGANLKLLDGRVAYAVGLAGDDCESPANYHDFESDLESILTQQ